MNAVKNKPATALPRIVVDECPDVNGFQTIREADGTPNGDTNTLIATVYKADNAAYIVHASNAYPKLVEAIREDLKGYLGDFPPGHAATKLRDLLRELGEAE